MQGKRVRVRTDGDCDGSLEEVPEREVSDESSRLEGASIGEKKGIPYGSGRGRKDDSFGHANGISCGGLRVKDGDFFGDCNVLLLLHFRAT